MVVKRILHYIKATSTYGPYFAHQSSPLLHGFSVSNWGGSVEDRKSTTWFAIFLGSHLISWASRKQHLVSRSSTEAEYRSIAAATSETTLVELLLKEIGCSSPSIPILWCEISALRI